MRLKNVQFTILLLLSFNFTGYAQNPYYNERPEFLKANSVWVFGDSAGINFNTGSPVPIKTAINNGGNRGNEGFASVADPITGELLFYSNGKSCWNANNQIMPNGDDLKGNGSGVNNGLSTTQGVCIVPVIDSPGKYYLFSLMGMTNNAGGDLSPYANGTLFYSVVNMDLESGLGNIEPGRKNILLHSDTLSESMIAVPGDNCDIWLIVHAYDKPEFIAYHITRDGLNVTPIVSNTGETAIRGYSSYRQGYASYAHGSMAISPDRKKIAITSQPAVMDWGLGYTACYGAMVAQFNPATGQVSNSIVIMDSAQYMFFNPNGVCFSPDNSKLYVLSSVFNDNCIFQFDVSVYDSTAIVNSTQRVATLSSFEDRTLRSYDNIIYVDRMQSQIGGQSFIGRINFPNLAGTACQYEDSAISLLNGTRCLIGLGNDVVYPFPPDTVAQLVLDTLICFAPEDGLLLSATPGYDTYEWSDGNKDEKRSITSAGTYWVYCKDYCHSRIDTFILKGFSFIKPEITINEQELGTTASYTNYQWLLNQEIIPGATQSTYRVSVNGFYQVIVSDENGCTDTSEVYEVTNATSIASLNSANIDIYPNPARDIVYVVAPVTTNLSLVNIQGKVVRQSLKSKEMLLEGLAEGIYFLQVRDQDDHLLRIEKIVKM